MNKEDLSLFRDMAVRAFEQEVTPFFEEWEEAEIAPRELWRTLGAAGLLCPDMPEQYGGAGTSPDVTVVIAEELARMGYGGIATGYNVHCGVVTAYVHNLGTEEQKQYWLPKMVSGEAMGAIAMTEPGAGSDVQKIRTQAVKKDRGWILNGSKTFISNGCHADLAVVAAVTDPGKGAKGISLFLVDASLPGFERGKKIAKMGIHSSDTAELFFSDVHLPEEALLGELNRGFMSLMSELPRERMTCAAQALGAAEGALEVTVNYVKEREAFGKPLSKLQNTRFKLADAKAQVVLHRTLYEKQLAAFAEGKLSADDAALLKLSTTEMSCRVIDDCLQMFGGYGYTAEYAISRFYRDVRIGRIWGGTSEIMRELVARSLLDS
ncbi:acyl-CoA dehydrogenase family protein [Maricurvus nonylphenolicus]|uniref:acyl-CoA dehydrogenase family protein n=1 Tax=Maricurvus nonylphenolicus TaxID=1008307 RepID=UPI0036F2D0AC